MPAVTVTTTPTLLCAAKGPSARGWILITVPPDAARSVFLGIGDAAVTTSTGHELEAGNVAFLGNDPLNKPATLAIYGRVASGTQSVTVSEGL